MSPTSPLPDFYYFVFAIYEPVLTTIGFLGAVGDPTRAHNAQAPWPPGTPPFQELPQATLVTTLQLAHVCGLLGLINIFVLHAIRKHVDDNVVLQEKLVRSLLTPLLIADFTHLYVTLWALGDQRWDVGNWTPMLWTTIGLGSSLLIPRIAWHMGIGRYVHARDAHSQHPPAKSNR